MGRGDKWRDWVVGWDGIIGWRVQFWVLYKWEMRRLDDDILNMLMSRSGIVIESCSTSVDLGKTPLQ